MDIQKNHKEHMLKTDPAVFQDVLDGSKTFEIRFNDRGYQIGDLIVLKETKFTGQQMKSGQPLAYTGREIQKRISYVLGGYGLQDDWVILGVQDIEAAKAQAVPEGFVLVNAEQLNQWGHMANAAEQYGCCDCFESRGYAHNLACEINSYFEPVEAQEQSHE